MLIQLIIFLTKTKIFASEINSSGKAESISIKGNAEIKCEGKESIDELIDCLYDGFNIDSFSDDDFDITIIDINSDSLLIKYLYSELSDVKKLNIISIERLLPLIVFNKSLMKDCNETFIEFMDSYYKIYLDDNNFMRTIQQKGKENITGLNLGDFAFLYNHNYNVSFISYEYYKQEVEEKNFLLKKIGDERNKLQREVNDANLVISNLENKITEHKNKIEELNNLLNAFQKENKDVESEELKRKLAIVKKYKYSFTKGFQAPSFYIKPDISENVLKNVLPLVSNTDIPFNKIIALYVGKNDYSNRDQKGTTNVMIFTEKQLYYDKGFRDAGGRKGHFAYDQVVIIKRAFRFHCLPMDDNRNKDSAWITLQHDKTIELGVGDDDFYKQDWDLDVEKFIELLDELCFDS